VAAVKAESLARRAFWLAAFAVGFWGLAVGLVVGFAALGAWIGRYAPEYMAAAFAAWGLAGALAVGLLPRNLLRKNEARPALSGAGDPGLRGFVRDVAERAGALEPDVLRVYHDANAFASLERRSLLGKRVSTIGIGLPLFALLRQDELRSVLAHEMGHHLAADVRLGPWVRRTRRAIATAAERFEGSSFWLHLPFLAYATFFMKASLRVSRAQELSADARAVAVAGRAATASALRKIEILGAAWQAYFASEVLPIVDERRLPPLLAGFELYWRAAQTPGTPAFAVLSSVLEASKVASPEDTHPPLAARLAALGDPAQEGDESPPAIALLDDVAKAEEQVLRELLRDRTLDLRPVAWEAVAPSVWLPIWRKAVVEAPPLKKLELADLAAAVEDWGVIAAGTRRGPALLSPQAERRRVMRLLGAWLTVTLADAGFRVTAAPGRAVCAEREGETLEPFALLDELATGAMAAEGWARICGRLSR